MRSGKYAAVRKLDLKEGLLKGMPVYIVTFFMLFILLILSILYAVTVGSADLSVKQVYDIILYELFRLGDPELLASGAVHDIVWVIRLPRIMLGVGVGMGLAVVGVVMQAIVFLGFHLVHPLVRHCQFYLELVFFAQPQLVSVHLWVR